MSKLAQKKSGSVNWTEKSNFTSKRFQIRLASQRSAHLLRKRFKWAGEDDLKRQNRGQFSCVQTRLVFAVVFSGSSVWAMKGNSQGRCRAAGPDASLIAHPGCRWQGPAALQRKRVIAELVSIYYLF
jgi:hypothetical protein